MSLRIKDIIKVKGLTVQSLADKMQINRVTLTNHIKGNPSVKVLQKIAVALEVNITDLFEQPEQASEFICPNCGTRLSVSKK